MSTYREAKVVTRWEAWCDECPWTYEDSDPEVIVLARLTHEREHHERGRRAK